MASLLEICNDRFIYSESERGLVGRRTDRKYRLKTGVRVGNSHHSGYKYVKILGKLYPEHALVWLMHYGEYPCSEIDHKDRVKDNNVIGNIRLSSRKFNCANRCGWNKLGYKGVGINKRGLPFNAQISYNGKTTWLGSYLTIEEAARAYDKKAAELFGESSKLNFKEN